MAATGSAAQTAAATAWAWASVPITRAPEDIWNSTFSNRCHIAGFFLSSFFLIQLKKSENVTGEIPRYIREKVDCVFQWNLIYFFHLLILENKNIISCYTIPKEIVKWLKIKRATFPFQYSVTIHFSSLSILLTLPPHLLSHWRRRWLPYIYSFYQHFYNIILWFHTNIKVLTQKKKEYKKKHKSFKLS